MNLTKSALAVVFLVASACGGVGGVVRNMNQNNGQQGNLLFATLEGLRPATGSTVVVEVGRAPSGDFRCTERLVCYSGSCPEECTFLGKMTSVTSLVSASCSANGCTATTDGKRVRLTTAQPGRVTYTVTAKLDDGTEVTDSQEAEFFRPDRISIACGSRTLCPGPNAVFVGASFPLVVQPAAGADFLDGEAARSVEPANVVELAADGVLRALAPGTATVTYRFGSLSAVAAVRVVAVADAVSGELRRLKPPHTHVPPLSPVAAASDPLGDPTSSEYNFAPLIVAWKLTDGTYAVASSNGVATDTADMAVIREVATGQVLTPMAFLVGSSPCVAKPAHVTDTQGTAKLDVMLQQLCP